MNVGSLLARHARFRPDHLAVVCGARRLTFAQHYAAVNRLSNALLGLGLEKGDKVAIILSNCVELLEAYRACAQLGLVSVPLSPLLRGPGLVTLLRDSETSAVIAGAAMIDALTNERSCRRSMPRTTSSSERRMRGYRDYAAFTAAATTSHRRAWTSATTTSTTSSTRAERRATPRASYTRTMCARALLHDTASQFRFTPESVAMHAGSLVFNGAFVTMLAFCTSAARSRCKKN